MNRLPIFSRCDSVVDTEAFPLIPLARMTVYGLPLTLVWMVLAKVSVEIPVRVWPDFLKYPQLLSLP